jgi:hypothetical protein
MGAPFGMYVNAMMMLPKDRNDRVMFKTGLIVGAFDVALVSRFRSSLDGLAVRYEANF